MNATENAPLRRVDDVLRRSPEDRLRVNEVFYSLQGESTRVHKLLWGAATRGV